MSIEVELRTEINRPLAEVFAYMADFSHIPEDDPDVKSISRTNDGPVGVGAAWTHKRSQAGYHFDATLEIVGFEQNKLIEVQSSGFGFNVHATQHYRAVDDNTTEIHEQMEMNLTGPGRLVKGLVRRTLPNQGRKVHDRIKARLEERNS